MIGALKQLEAGRKAEDVAREVGVSKHTIYAWKAKYGGMDVSQAQEAKQLRDENTKLRKLGGGSTLVPRNRNSRFIPMDFIHGASTEIGHEQPPLVGEVGLVERGFQLTYFSEGCANIDDNENWSLRATRSDNLSEVFQKGVVSSILHPFAIQLVNQRPLFHLSR
jgi:hypothetical protein